MTTQEALCLLEASRNDPVLAAWAAVFYEHRVLACYDASPYDAWDAYQELFMLGVVSPSDFDNTDVKQVFFSGRRPSENEIQDALDNLHIIPCREGSEMPKLGNPFGSQQALTPRPTNHKVAVHSTRLVGSTALGSPHLQTATLAPHQGLAPSTRPSLGQIGPPMQRQPAPELRPGDIEALKPVMYCSCGEELVLKNDGGQIIDEDDMPQGNIRIIDAIFSAECPGPNCNKVWHCSVGEAIPEGTFR